MSYEGYKEYLCEDGHLIVVDVWEPNPEKCRASYVHVENDIEVHKECGKKIVFENSVDVTNGPDPETELYPGQIVYKIKEEASYISRPRDFVYVSYIKRPRNIISSPPKYEIPKSEKHN